MKNLTAGAEDIDGFFVGFVNYMDPYTYFHRRFHSASIPGGNSCYYSNPAVDKLIEASARTVNREERAKLFNRIQETLYEELPVIPIACPTSTIAVNKRVKGVQNTVLPVTRNIHQWEIR
jgi:peptide/nickel transport system substrate-binding protein